MTVYAKAPQFGKPVPMHAMTPEAKRARKQFKAWAAENPLRVARSPKTGRPMATRKPLGRDEVVADYVHPAPEKRAREVLLSSLAGGPKTFANAAVAARARVKATAARGTTAPKWWVNAPDSKPNPGPQVAHDQYHGVVVDSVVVWVITAQGRRIRAVWHDGKFFGAEVDRVGVNITQAKAAL